MTIEELTEALEKANADIEALRAKNAEIIAEKKKAAQQAEAAAAAAQQAEDERNLATEDVAKVRETLEAKHKRDLEKLAKERDDAIAVNSRLLIDNQIAADLVGNNVAKHFHSVLAASFKAQATIENGEAVIGNDTLSDYIKNYLAGDEGKHFVTAPMNTGAGATGSTGTTTDPRAGLKKADGSLNQTAFGAFYKEDPVAAKAWAETNAPEIATNL